MALSIVKFNNVLIRDPRTTVSAPAYWLAIAAL